MKKHIQMMKGDRSFNPVSDRSILHTNKVVYKLNLQTYMECAELININNPSPTDIHQWSHLHQNINELNLIIQNMLIYEST